MWLKRKVSQGVVKRVDKGVDKGVDLVVFLLFVQVHGCGSMIVLFPQSIPYITIQVDSILGVEEVCM